VIKGRDIICFSNDWDSDPLSKKHIMTRLAKSNRVLWINSIGLRKPTATTSDFKRVFSKLTEFVKGHRQVTPSIYVFSPIAIPFHSSAIAHWVNRRVLTWSVRRICRKLGFHDPITWTFVPSSAGVAGSLGEKALIYHCVDEYSEFSGMNKEALLALERSLIERSDCVIVSSDILYGTKRTLNPHTHLVTHGVDVAHFRQACDPTTTLPDDVRALPKPVIGFFGLIADWVDLDLIRFIADSRPNWNIVLIGKSTTDLDPVRGAANVHVLGQQPYSSLPAYAKGFDVAILPFVVNDLTRAANPLKLREYLAAGLPVVASAIPEAEKLSAVLKIGRNRKNFLDQIQKIIDSGRTGPQMAISRQMDSESWDAKVEQMCRLLPPMAAYAAARPLVPITD
jgi:glycosyltransferase involved in cell wall biosynthesis